MPNITLKKTALAAAVLLEVSAAQAAIIEVDNNTCVLADAITAANEDIATNGCDAGSQDDIINLPSDSIISLTEALPSITTNVTINANGSSVLRDTNASSNFPVISGGSLLNLPTIAINDINISGGFSDYNVGGGISVFAGSLILNNSNVSDNTGGGISVTRGDSSTITNSVVAGNITAAGPYNYYGGGIAVSGGNMDIISSTITSNQSTVASQLGGGLYLTSYAGETTVNVINSTISSNSAVSNGGGVVMYKNEDADLTVSMSHTTVIGNDSGSGGGGIFNDEGILNISSSLIAGNTAASIGENIEVVDNTVTTSNNNLFGFNDTSGVTGVTLGMSDLVPMQASLGDIIETTLADNGSNTPTHNLVVDSPAIDVIDGSCAQATDQVGNIRPIDGDGDMTAACDIGAIEFQPAVVDLIFADGFELTDN